MREAYLHCEALVREADKDRFLAGLFAPAEARPHLHALHAFNIEVARVRALAREPMPGEIRLQWWEDALAGPGHGDVAAHPVAAALLATVECCALPRQVLVDLIEARRFDLYDDPMASLADLETYARRTASALFALAAQVIGATRPPAAVPAAAQSAATSGGIAYALAGLMRAFPDHAGGRRLYLPADLLARHGVAPADVFARRAGAGLAAALAELRAHAEAKLAEAEAALPESPAAAALLPLALVRPLLRRLARESDPFTPVEVPQWRRQWALWRAARALKD